MQPIHRKDYPELNLLMWDIRSDTIEPEQAFHLYETRWSHVSQKHLTGHEKILIQELTEIFGNGLFLIK